MKDITEGFLTMREEWPDDDDDDHDRYQVTPFTVRRPPAGGQRVVCQTGPQQADGEGRCVASGSCRSATTLPKAGDVLLHTGRLERNVVLGEEEVAQVCDLLRPGIWRWRCGDRWCPCRVSVVLEVFSVRGKG